MGCRWPARSGRRTAARTRQPSRASARTACRPTKPEPPNTVTRLPSSHREAMRPVSSCVLLAIPLRRSLAISPPPCGEGLGVGVTPKGLHLAGPHHPACAAAIAPARPPVKRGIAPPPAPKPFGAYEGGGRRAMSWRRSLARPGSVRAARRQLIGARRVGVSVAGGAIHPAPRPSALRPCLSAACTTLAPPCDCLRAAPDSSRPRARARGARN